MNQGQASVAESPRMPRIAPPAAEPFRIADTEGVLATVRVRSAEESDLPFLCRVYASARADEMAATGWSAAEIADFIGQQFTYQHRYYQEHYPQGQFMVVTRDGQDIGRLYWRTEGSEAALMDISFLPEYRGAGIGSAIMSQLTALADANSQTITLYVEPYNPALRLYQRFGFEQVGENGVYHKMCRTPQEERR